MPGNILNLPQYREKILVKLNEGAAHLCGAVVH